MRGDVVERAQALQEAGADVLVLDIAHGHSERAIDALGRVREAVGLLSSMDNATKALALAQEIDGLESEADAVMRAGISKLFREEADVRQLIKHKNVYEYLENAIDKCQDVANVIESVVVENV